LLAEPAEPDVPVVDEVRPGIWALPLPIPGPLRYVYVYLVTVDGGLVLIDGGWDSDEAFAALETGLAAISCNLSDVTGMLFTHAHPDHYGLARRVVDATGAWTALHAADAAALERLANRSAAKDDTRQWLRELGVGADERPAVEEALAAFANGPRPPAPTRTIADGQVFGVSSGTLVAMHTPGHAPGHVCFVHQQAGIVFAGDHVLSKTTPHVSSHPGSPPNPLEDYLGSLRRVLPLGDLLTLPGHEQRVPIAGRARDIMDHHERQLRSIEAILRSDSATTAEIASQMKWSTPWQRLGPVDRYLAMCEALAHVAVLEERNVLEQTSSGPMRWRATSRPEAGVTADA
jgi:glyoxylase-like metal-dependent hydrolase (beta-lactamase superfamily II)